MVALLVVLTIVGFVLADWISQLVAARRARRATRIALEAHRETEPRALRPGVPLGGASSR